jgi:exonuclease SbcC
MKFERLELKNFEGYKNAEIRFAQGLNVITGRNSSGKTTILDAILFALYGTVPDVEKNLLPSRLLSASGNLMVKLSAEVSRKHVEILREGKLVGKSGEKRKFTLVRLGLKVDGKEVPVSGEEDLNKKIRELMGIGLKTFVNLSYAGQGKLTSILKPEKDEMDFILGISLMKELVQQLNQVKKTFEIFEGKDARTVFSQLKEHQIPTLEGQIKLLAKEVENYSEDVKALEGIVEKAKSEEFRKLIQLVDSREKLQKDIGEKNAGMQTILKRWNVGHVEELEKQIEILAERMSSLEKCIKKDEEKESRLSEERDRLNGKISGVKTYLSDAGVSSLQDLENKIKIEQENLEDLRKKLEDAEKNFEEIGKRKSELEGQKSALEKEIKGHKDLLKRKVAKCPTCGQDVDANMLKQIMETKEREVKKIEKTLAGVKQQYESLNGTIKDYRNKISDLESNVKNLQKTCNKIADLLENNTLEELKQNLEEVEESLRKLSDELKSMRDNNSQLKVEKEKLEKDVGSLKELENGILSLNKSLDACKRGIESGLKALALPFKADDPDLKSKITEKIPFNIEELERREKELEQKRMQLNELKQKLEEAVNQKNEAESKFAKVERRLKKADLCKELVEKLESGIEGQRRLRLKRIADEALRVYETLTDQRMYKAFRIDEEDYTVEVQETNCDGYLNANRTGGGHQTLIALSLRVALLNVLGDRSLMIMDEPTYGVDSENLPQLMSYISEISKKVDQVIIVTHHGLGLEEASNVISVSKVEDGSSIVSYG